MAVYYYMDRWGLYSFLVTLIALLVAFWQLRRTKKSVDAANESMRTTAAAFRSNVVIANSSTLTEYIVMIKEYIRNDDIKPALIRIGDLKAELIRLTHALAKDSRIGLQLRRQANRLSEAEVKVEKSLELSSPLTKKVFSKLFLLLAFC